MTLIAAHAGVIGLLFFFLFFTGMAVWIYRPGSRVYYKTQAHIPLNEDHHD